MSMVAGFYNPAPPRQEMIAHIRAAVRLGAAQGRHAGSILTRMVIGAETVDRSYPRHD